MDRIHRRASAITLGLATLLYLAWALEMVWRSSVVGSDTHRYFILFDDAMVSMRYAWNLAHGRGCVWNPGEHVQGFTTPLMVGLMALPCTLLSKSAACLVVQLFGIPTVLGVAWYARRIAGFISDNRWLTTGSFVAVLAYYPLSYWSLMGMETGVVCLCMLAAVFHTLRQEVGRSSLAMGLAFLARPDFLVIAALLVAYLFLAKRSRGLLSAAALGAFVVATFAAQYLYYGDPLPNPYTLKVVGYPLVARINRGAGFVTPFLAATVPLVAFAMAAVASVGSRARYLLLLIACAVIAYQITVGGDPWPYWRMTTPMMPVLLGLAAVGAHVVLRRNTVATLAAMALSVLLCDAPFLQEMTFQSAPYKHDENADNLNTALLLNRVLPAGASVGVVYAGVLPYFTDFRAIDFLGKCDRHIAQLAPRGLGRAGWSSEQASLPGHNKYDLDYSIGVLKPDYIQIYRYGRSDTSAWIEQLYEFRDFDGRELIVRRGRVP